MKPFTVVNYGTDEEAWLASRTQGIGASEIAMVLGKSSFKSALELWEEKVHDDAPGIEPTERMFWGKKLERTICEELCARAGIGYAHNRALLRSTAHAWAIATPDGLTFDGEPVEAKNLAFIREDEWEEFGIPEPYYLQCQHQCLVTGAKRCLFGALLNGNQLVWSWVDRDDETIATIVEAGERFWQLVLTRTMPPSDGSQGARKVLARRAGEGHVDLDTDAVEELLEAIASAKAEEKDRKKAADAAEKARRAHEDALAALLGGAERGETLGGLVVEWVVSERAGYTVQPSVLKTLKIRKPKRGKRAA